MPPTATKLKSGKISKFQILTPSQGHVMSVKCEKPLDELTAQVWFLYDHPNLKYCTLYVSGTELRTEKQTDDPITRCLRRTFQAGGILTMQILYALVISNIYLLNIHSLSLYPRGDAVGLSREYVLHIPSVS